MFNGPLSYQQIPTPSSPPCGSSELSRQVENSIKWEIHISDHDLVYDLLKQSTLILASDGGHHHSGSFAWVLATSTETIIAKGQGLVPGTLALMSSFRAEAAGLLHGLIAMGHILRLLAMSDHRLLKLHHLFQITN